MQQLRPAQDRILVIRTTEMEKTKGGILIPDNSREKPSEGTVVAVGNGRMLDSGAVKKPSVKAGDKILFTRYSGSELVLDGQEHIMLREEDILGVVE